MLRNSGIRERKKEGNDNAADRRCMGSRDKSSSSCIVASIGVLSSARVKVIRTSKKDNKRNTLDLMPSRMSNLVTTTTYVQYFSGFRWARR